MVGLNGGQLQILSHDEISSIHKTTIETLDNVGVKIIEPNAFKILKDGGAETDEKTKIVRLPEHLVKDALQKTPSEFTIYARNHNYDVKIEKNRVYFGPMIGRIYILDLETGNRRHTNIDDVGNLCKVADAMENYRLIHSGAVMPHIEGVPDSIAHVQGYLTSIKNTSKVVKATAKVGRRAKECLRMAAVLAGGEEELRKKPMIYTTVNPISPLQYYPELTEGLLEYARLGQPVDFGVEIQAGATGPITLAGILVQQAAEWLSGNVIAQLVNPGTPVFFGNCSTIMDMRTGAIALGAIESGILNVASAQMARYYNVPCRGTAGDTESKLLDIQNGYERSLNLLLASLAGINYVFYPGTLESARTISLEQLVIDDEICGMIYRVLKGVTIDEESLARDVISSVGPGGHYLGQMHTIKFLDREQYTPKISNRESREAWEKTGAKNLRDVARERVKNILRDHNPDPLDQDVEKELQDIVKEVEKKETRG